MKNILFTLALSLVALALPAQDFVADISLPLYPAGQAKDCGIVENGVPVTLGPQENNGLSGQLQEDADGMIRNIGDDARIDIYLPAKGNGQMLVCCPGGGYRFVSARYEGENVARWCIARGIACCVVIYRLPNAHACIPLTDVQNAFRYCRAHQQEWGVRQIGIIGFSAGGHLAASASTLFQDECTRPDFSILIYPVITMEEGVTHRGSKKRLTGGDPAMAEAYSLENRVNAQTPPTFIALSLDDDTVPVENSFRYCKQLASFHIPAAMHVFPTGGHGWGFYHPAYRNDRFGERQRAALDTLLEDWLAGIALTEKQ